MTGEIVNRVAHSALQTFDLADYHDKGERVVIDIKDRLFMGQILREKDFREWVKSVDWSEYKGKNVLLTCSADAIVPVWAYMILATVLEPFCAAFVFGYHNDLETLLFLRALDKVEFSEYEGKKVVVKGCGDVEVPTAVYVELTRRLRPYAEKIMYGEPCSTVPLYKKS
jgi:hypothetical protein